MKHIIFLFSILLGLDSNASCPDGFESLFNKVRVENGSRASLRGFENYDVRRLGTGEVGGTSYLVNPPGGGAPFAVKVYDIGGQRMATNDRAGLEILAQVESKIVPVKVLESIDARTLKIEYAPGSDLERFSEIVSGDERATLSNIYREHVQKIEAALTVGKEFQTSDSIWQVASAHRLSSSPSWPIFEIRLRNRKPDGKPAEIRIRIKPDNIIVSPTGDMRTIDPY